MNDLDPLRKRLRELGAALAATEDEENIYYDRRGELAARHEVLRLRRNSRVRLTWKGPATYTGGVNARPELEVAVSDFEILKEMLERIDFTPAQHLPKRREVWRLAGTASCFAALSPPERFESIEIMLDELPFGQFIEIEGSDAGIAATAAALGLDLRRGLRQSYLELLAERGR